MTPCVCAEGGGESIYYKYETVCVQIIMCTNIKLRKVSLMTTTALQMQQIVC